MTKRHMYPICHSLPLSLKLISFVGHLNLEGIGKLPISETQHKEVSYDTHIYMELPCKGMMSGDKLAEMMKQEGNEMTGN